MKRRWKIRYRLCPVCDDVKSFTVRDRVVTRNGERVGIPCSWVSFDLCSHCVTENVSPT